jgi:hypothetical protein
MERTGGTNTYAPRREKGAGQMRTLRDLEVDTELDSEPTMTEDPLSNTDATDPD